MLENNNKQYSLKNTSAFKNMTASHDNTEDNQYHNNILHDNIFQLFFTIILKRLTHYVATKWPPAMKPNSFTFSGKK